MPSSLRAFGGTLFDHTHLSRPELPLEASRVPFSLVMFRPTINQPILIHKPIAGGPQGHLSACRVPVRNTTTMNDTVSLRKQHALALVCPHEFSQRMLKHWTTPRPEGLGQHSSAALVTEMDPDFGTRG